LESNTEIEQKGRFCKRLGTILKMTLRKFYFSIRCPLLCISGFLFLFVFSYTLPSDAASGSEKEHFDLLGERLVKEGFDRKYIEKIYGNPKVQLETKGISLFSVHKESKLNYKQFLSKSNIRKAKKYLNNHLKTLQNAEKEFGVEKEIITAVILVETRLGTYFGKSSILNTLSTMAVLSNPKSRAFVWERVSKSERHSRKAFDIWADKKTEWAYRELKAFLEYTQREKIDPLTINGSYAGALGIGQFMPSSILKLGIDGNRDGRIDLFNHEDAIASIANYLKAHGWKPGIEHNKKYKVLLRYNYSKYYVKTLLEIAENLKG
jgi:membrane-bound lytic murein transglycosylase B